MPPAPANSRLSTSNCRSSTQRPAPNASRTAISFRRWVARARRRLVTLVQAMSSTSITAPRSVASAVRTLGPASRSCRAIAVTLLPALLSGYSFASRAATASRPLRAEASLTPGFKRPMTYIPGCQPRCSVHAALCPTGVHNSTRRGNWNAAGRMPTTVYGSPFNATVRFNTPGSPPKRLRQMPSLSTTTRSPPTLSSSAVNTRPRSGCTPSVGKKPAETCSPVMRSGWPSPVRFHSSVRNAAKLLKLSCWRCQSRKFG